MKKSFRQINIFLQLISLSTKVRKGGLKANKSSQFIAKRQHFYGLHHNSTFDKFISKFPFISYAEKVFVSVLFALKLLSEGRRKNKIRSWK